MTTLSKDKIRSYELGNLNDLPVVASDIVYEGAAVGLNASGYARPLVAGDKFAGFAEIKADNSNGSNGEIDVNVKNKGRVEVAISGFAITNVLADVYASDDDTFTLTSTANTLIGKAIRYVSSGVAIVEFNAGA